MPPPLLLASHRRQFQLESVNVPAAALLPVPDSSSLAPAASQLHAGSRVFAQLPGCLLWAHAEVAEVDAPGQRVVAVTLQDQRRHMLPLASLALAVHAPDLDDGSNLFAGASGYGSGSSSGSEGSVSGSDMEESGSEAEDEEDEWGMGRVSMAMAEAVGLQEAQTVQGPQTETALFFASEGHSRGIGSKVSWGGGAPACLLPFTSLHSAWMCSVAHLTLTPEPLSFPPSPLLPCVAAASGQNGVQGRGPGAPAAGHAAGTARYPAKEGSRAGRRRRQGYSGRWVGSVGKAGGRWWAGPSVVFDGACLALSSFAACSSAGKIHALLKAHTNASAAPSSGGRTRRPLQGWSSARRRGKRSMSWSSRRAARGCLQC